jgi:hypothetical protein
MSTRYARFNLQLITPAVDTDVTKWHEQLHYAATEGYAEDFEVFYSEEEAIIGVSVPYETDDPMTLLEAGLVLGYCLRCYESLPDTDIFEHNWCSLHEADGTVVESTL